MLIYIRHADKQYANGKSKKIKHDPGLTTDGKNESIKTAKNLYELYGKPDLIICSPYLRTRETAVLMNSIFESPCDIEIDINISEYLGNRSHEKLDVTNETFIYNPPHPETFNDMKKRVKIHNDLMIQNRKKIWIITHGLIIKQIFKLNYISNNDVIYPLYYIIIENQLSLFESLNCNLLNSSK